MIVFYGGANSSPQQLELGYIIGVAIAVAVIYIALYVLRSIGLYKLASGQGYKFKWMAVLPLVWIYVAVRLVGETKFFGEPLAKLAIIITIIVSLSALVNLAYEIIVYYPLAGNLLFNDQTVIHIIADDSSLTQMYTPYSWVSGVYIDGNFINPYFNISLVETWLNVLSYIGLVVDLATIIIKVTIFINIFRKYWPQKMMIAGILSVFFESLMFPIFIFVIRNNKPVNYEEFIRKKYQYVRNPYGAYGQGGPYGNPYANGPYEPNPEKTEEEPFGEFGQENSEPFSEFDKDDAE